MTIPRSKADANLDKAYVEAIGKIQEIIDKMLDTHLASDIASIRLTELGIFVSMSPTLRDKIVCDILTRYKGAGWEVTLIDSNMQPHFTFK